MSLFAELKRRNVFRVGIAYLAASWLLIQVADILFPEFGIGVPVRALAIILAIGLIPALVAAWVFEITPEGIKRDGDADRAPSSSRRMSRRFDRAIIVVLSLAIVVLLVDEFLIDRFVPDAELSIAVMPFIDMSPGEDQGYFSDGIAEEIIHVLEKLPGLRVISRSSSFALRDDDLGVAELADKLDVAYLLEGSVRPDGDTVRVTAQLIDASSDKHLWSETYDREIGGVLEIQERIAEEVARQLQLRLLTAGPARYELDPVTYDLYLQGLYQLALGTDDGSGRAVNLFDQVRRIAPEFSPAHSSLAIALIYSSGDEETNLRIEAAANAALRLDPDNSRALAALGLTRLGDLELDAGRSLLQQAIEANPNNPLAYRWLGTSYVISDAPRYYALANQALRIDPLDPSLLFHVATAATRLGRYDEARRAARRMHERGRESSAYSLAAQSYMREGLLDMALIAQSHSFRANPSGPGHILIAVNLMSLNELDLAQAWLDYGAAGGWGDEDIVYASANLATLLGDPDAGMRLVVAARENGVAISDDALAWLLMRVGRDFNSGLELIETVLSLPGQGVRTFDPELENLFTKYALALERTGRLEEAMALTGEILAFVDGQVAVGAMSGEYEHWQLVRARLYAIRGDKPAAIAALRRAADQGGLARIQVVDNEPYFDLLRDDPEFVQILAEQKARNRVMRDNLRAQDMLLGPEQVLELADFPVDAFP